MGVYFSIYISKSVTQEQWEPVYQEALFLAEKLNLMEWGKVKRFGLDLHCGLAIKETELGRNSELGFCIDGDSASMRRGEPQCIHKELTTGEPVADTKILDPFMLLLDIYGIVNNEEMHKSFYHCFGNKTQYEPYHIGLVSIALLIEDRLNGAATCLDEITYNICVQAVNEANKYLEKPIQLPVRCRKENLYARIKKLPMPKDKILQAFDFLYLGERDKSFFEFVAQTIPDDEKQDLLNHFVSNSWVRPNYKTASSINILFNYGFNISELCEAFVCANQNCKDGDGKEDDKKYKHFIEEILDTKIYKEKPWLNDAPCENESNENLCQNKRKLYTAESFFFQVISRDERLILVEKYIPLDVIEKQLISCFGDKCDVKKIITDYINDETAKKQKSQNVNNEDDIDYDIMNPIDLLSYKRGDSILPLLLEGFTKYIAFYKTALYEDDYLRLKDASWEAKCINLIMDKHYPLMMESTWDKIFDDIKNNPESFARYYPMSRVKIENFTVMDTVRAYVENDDFYEFCKDF